MTDISAGQTPTLADLLQCCRFCLRYNANAMRHLPVSLLPHTDIPYLFEIVTALPLDLSTGYSELLCNECEQRMRTVAQTRADFRRTVQEWQRILYSIVPTTAAGTTVPFKTEQEQDQQLQKNADSAEDDDDDIVAKSVKCDLLAADDVKLENEESMESRAIDANAVEGNDWAEEDDEDSESTRSGTAIKTKRGRRPAFGKPPRGEPLMCDICMAILTTRDILIRHMRTKHQPRTTNRPESAATTGSTCHICGKTNIKAMVDHMRDHRHADQYKCAYCPKTFCRDGRRRQHERTHTGERPFICEMCGFSFTSPTGLKRHTKLRHSASGTKHAALVQRPQKQQIVRTRILPPPPSPSIDQAAMLKKLQPAQPDQTRLECAICHNTYANRPSLNTHLKVQHGAEGVAEWKRFLATVCAICGNRFADATELAAHRPVHQPYECEICRRRFESEISWQLHVQKHPKKERRHACDVCGARFSCTFTMRMHHRRAHTDYRPFPCAHCDLSFAENAEMTAHMRKRHTFTQAQRRTFVCEVCPKGTPPFRTMDVLRRHMENHTGRFRYQCKVCMRRQATAVQLLEHMRNYHPAQLREMDGTSAGGVGGGEGGDGKATLEIAAVSGSGRVERTAAARGAIMELGFGGDGA